MTRKILNVGCGNRPVEGAVNHDIRKHSDHVDIAHDLNIMPWPWEDEEFDLVVAKAVYEHLDPDLLTIMNETWRILKPDGRTIVKLPWWKSEVTYSDPTHRRGYALGVLDQLCPETKRGKEYWFYTDRKWKIVKPAKLNNAKTSFYITLEKIGGI